MQAIWRFRISAAWSAIQSVKLRGTAARRGQARRPQADRPQEMPAPDHPVAAHRHLHQLAFRVHGSWPRCWVNAQGRSSS